MFQTTNSFSAKYFPTIPLPYINNPRKKIVFIDSICLNFNWAGSVRIFGARNQFALEWGRPLPHSHGFSNAHLLEHRTKDYVGTSVLSKDYWPFYFVETATTGSNGFPTVHSKANFGNFDSSSTCGLPMQPCTRCFCVSHCSWNWNC